MKICFWCRKSKDDIVDDKPEFFDYEPCDTCQGWWDKGILVVEVVTEPNGNPQIIDELYPTGFSAVVGEDNVKEILTTYPSLDMILKSRTMYLNKTDWDKFFP